MVLGPQTSETNHNCSNMQNFTSVSIYIYTFLVKDLHNIPIGVLNINQAQRALHRYPICLTESDHEYIIDQKM